VGRIAGIDLYVHGTFVLFLGWIALSHALRGHGVAETAAGVALILSVFAIVVLHEMGHALMARRFGIGTRDITLLPMGGVARLERMPDDPKQELLVALAGPAVNAGLAAMLFGLLALLKGPLGLEDVSVVGGPFVTKLMWINVGLAVFNLLPAFPMDGGRVARALLAMYMDPVRATDWAAALGRAFAIFFGLVGFFVNPMLVFVALFVWMGAQEEAALAHVRWSLHGVSVGQAMITRFRALSPYETVGHAVEHVLSGFQEDFPVVDGTHVVGILTRADLLRAVAAGQSAAAVGAVMRRSFATATEGEPLTEVMQRMNDAETRTTPVVRDGMLVGLLTPERIGEILLLREGRGLG
jgi:Zn-dependent protease/CBS domain-containing protein